MISYLEHSFFFPRFVVLTPPRALARFWTGPLSERINPGLPCYLPCTFHPTLQQHDHRLSTFFEFFFHCTRYSDILVCRPMRDISVGDLSQLFDLSECNAILAAHVVHACISTCLEGVRLTNSSTVLMDTVGYMAAQKSEPEIQARERHGIASPSGGSTKYSDFPLFPFIRT